MFSLFKRNKVALEDVYIEVSKAVSFHNEKLHEYFSSYISSRKVFLSKYEGVERFEGVDVSLLTDRRVEFDDESAHEVFWNYYQDSGYILIFDWKDKLSEIQPQIANLLKKIGIVDFDWGCVAGMPSDSDYYKVFDKISSSLKKHEMSLISLQSGDDGSNCAIVNMSDAKTLTNRNLGEHFEITVW